MAFLTSVVARAGDAAPGPALGRKGGSVRAVVDAGRRADGWGLVVSASRSILYAGGPDQIRQAVETARGELDLASVD